MKKMGPTDYGVGSHSNKILLGRWEFLKSEGWAPFGEGVTLTFLSDGTLTTTIRTDVADQEMSHHYIVLGERIILYEALHFPAEGLRFAIDRAGSLLLDFGEGRVWLKHA